MEKTETSKGNPVALLENISKTYSMGGTTIYALRNVNYAFYRNELTLILGPSGSGKTTLLSVLGSVIYPSTGKVWINGTLINDLIQNELSDLRLNNFGFVFQAFNLISPLNALENVMQPLILKGKSRREAEELANNALQKVNMTDRKFNLPKNLSGGQQQRVAIARALINDPPIILCDEPTASLDQSSVRSVMEWLKMLSKEGRSVIVVTHDHRLKAYADNVIYIDNGEIASLPPDEDELINSPDNK